MIDLGNGTYQIKNRKTGKTKVITADELPLYGLSAPVPASTNQLPEENNNVVSSLIDLLVPRTKEAVTSGVADIEKKKVERAKKKNPKGNLPESIKQAAQSTADLAQTTIPGGLELGTLGAGGLGKTLLQRLLAGGISGGGYQVAQQLGDDKEGIDPGAIAGSAALTSLLPAGIKFISRPIEPFAQKAVDVARKSNKTINLDDLKALFSSESVHDPRLRRLTVADRESGVMNTKIDVEKRFRELMDHIGGTGEITNALPGDVPVSTAQTVKSELQGLVNNYKGYSSDTKKPEVEATRFLAKLLRQAIEEAEPGVKLPNKIASGMHSLEDVLKLPSFLLPGRMGTAARQLGEIPIRGAQRGGDATSRLLQYLLPALYNQADN